MTLTDWIILITELIGTVAFALSGGLTAIERRLDFFGIIVLSIITAMGGGFIRDLILGITPPAMFRNYIYVATALISAIVLLVFASLFSKWLNTSRMQKLMHGINLFDAVGLGIFTVIGINAAVDVGYGANGFLMVFVGVITGIGGGMMRDVLVGRTPQVLRKDVYAIAAIIGGVCYHQMLKYHVSTAVAMLIGAVIIITIRLFGLYYQWNLPTITSSSFQKKNKK